MNKSLNLIESIRLLCESKDLDFTTTGHKEFKHGKTTIRYEVRKDDYFKHDDVEIHSVRTPAAHRGQGHAHAAMKLITHEADKHGKKLRLIASALDKKTSSAKLVSFYQKHGFEKTGERANPVGDEYMERQPKAHEALMFEGNPFKHKGFDIQKHVYLSPKEKIQIIKKRKRVGDVHVKDAPREKKRITAVYKHDGEYYGSVEHRTSDNHPGDIHWYHLSKQSEKETTEDLQEHSSIEPGKSFKYVRNTVSSKKFKVNQDFGQDVEPAGRYMSHVEKHPDHIQHGWEHGEHTFHNPLHIQTHHEDSNRKWKDDLSQKYGGKTGKHLSQAIRDSGHDGIVTHDKYGTSEIIDISHLKPKKAQK